MRAPNAKLRSLLTLAPLALFAGLPLLACGGASKGPNAPTSSSSATSAASIAPDGPHDDAVLRLVLADYDPATKGLKVQPVVDADQVPHLRVRSTRGDEIDAHPDPTIGKPQVRAARGTGWAAGLELDWVVVGIQPSVCGNEQGFFAVTRFGAGEPSLVASAPWTGGCGSSPSDVQFVTAAGQKVILEGDADAGEESPSEGMFHAWVVDDRKLAPVGTVRRGLEDTRESSAVNGFMRKMSATVEGTDGGLRIQEAWTFTPIAKGAPREKRVTREVKLVSGKLVGDAPADPLP
jgi:hypothetical protein